MSDIDIESTGYKQEDQISEDSNDGLYHFDYYQLDKFQHQDIIIKEMESDQDIQSQQDELRDQYSEKLLSKNDTLIYSTPNKIQLQEVRKTKIQEDCGYFIMNQCKFSSPYCWRLHRSIQERQINPLPIVPSIDELNMKEVKQNENNNIQLEPCQNNQTQQQQLQTQQQQQIQQYSIPHNKQLDQVINIKQTQQLIVPRRSIFQNSVPGLEYHMQKLCLRKSQQNKNKNKNISIQQKKNIIIEQSRKTIRTQIQNQILQNKRMKLLEINLNNQQQRSQQIQLQNQQSNQSDQSNIISANNKESIEFEK